MLNPATCRISYRRSRFSTQLPTDRLYTPAHFWLKEIEPGTWTVGYTRFATRMLGDLVEHGFEVKLSESIELGQTIGWIEAFKAITDIYAVGNGTFIEGNPILETTPARFDKDCYGDGWLYKFQGTPGSDALTAEAYTKTLDSAIDKVLGKEQSQ